MKSYFLQKLEKLFVFDNPQETYTKVLDEIMRMQDEENIAGKPATINDFFNNQTPHQISDN